MIRSPASCRSSRARCSASIGRFANADGRAIGLSKIDEKLMLATRKQAMAKIDVRCVPLATDASVVTVEVPPLARLD